MLWITVFLKKDNRFTNWCNNFLFSLLYIQIIANEIWDKEQISFSKLKPEMVHT